ncbi:MAG: FAD-dependent oxidoreductase [Hungatella sp.]
MKILVIGGVAAGTKVAAKMKREDRSAEVILFNKGKNISYAGCGLPYYVGNVIKEKEDLIVNTPAKYTNLTGVEVKNEHEVTQIDRAAKTISAVDQASGIHTSYDYDKLVIAVGASPIKPAVEGIDLDHVFFMRTPEDAIGLRETIETAQIKRAVVVGGGFIGLEIAENLTEQGIRTIVMDMAPNVLPGFDEEMCNYVENHLADHGIACMTGTKLQAILGDGKVEKVQTDKRAIKADLVVISVGIRPNTAFLKDSGLEFAKNGAILVDEHMCTNDPDIYAAGDCVMVKNRITGQETYSPMGSSANIEGRLLAQNITGKDQTYAGVLGTAVCKLPELNVGRCGLTQVQAQAAGYEPITVVTVVDDKAHYYPGAGSFYIKMIADRPTGQFLGIQVLGKGAVDKMVDIAVVALTMKAKLTDLVNMDLAYAPPFSTAIHPFVTTLNVLLNKCSGEFETFTPAEYAAGAAKGYRVIDTCLVPTIVTAPYVDLTKVNGIMDDFGVEEKLLLICNKGKRAYLLQNRMKFYGYQNTRVLEGGTLFNEIK